MERERELKIGLIFYSVLGVWLIEVLIDFVCIEEREGLK